MKARYLNRSVTITTLGITLPSKLVTPPATLTPGVSSLSAIDHDLSDVVVTDFTTIFLTSYTIEDVGFLEVISIIFQARARHKGNGSSRWQISGDGGSTWVTAVEANNFNYAIFTFISGYRPGLWVPIIQTGIDKFQLRFQVKANVGTVNSKIQDSDLIFLTYRKTVLF